MSKSTRWYWIALLCLALLTRLSALDAALLAPAEARAALEALAAAQQGHWPTATASPLLLVGNALLFLLFGGGSGLARLLPALAGALLALTPWLWRDALPAPRSRNPHAIFGVWSAAALLTLSPIALFVSRQVDGAALGALGGALTLTALFTACDKGDSRRDAWLLGAGLAVGLTGGPAFYDVLIPGLLAWGVWRWAEGCPFILTRTQLRAVGLGLLVALLLSLGLGWRWNGWAGPVEGLAAWLREWRVPAATPANPLLLLLYEPLTLLLAAVGLGLAIRKNEPALLALAAWAVLATLLPALRTGAAPAAFLAPLLPLALLGGWAAQHFTLPRRLAGDGWKEWLHTALGLVLWLFIALVLLRQAGAPHNANGLELPLVALVLVIHGLMAVGFATVAGERRAMTGLLYGAVAVLCLLQMSFGFGAAFVRPGNPAEPLVATGASADLRNLRRTIEDLRIARALSPDTPELVLVENDPAAADIWAAVRWALQPLPLRSVAAWPADAPEMLLTLEGMLPPEGAGAAYNGAAFIAVMQTGGAIPGCEPGVFPPICTHPLGWYFHRRTPIAPQITRVILWASSPGE